MLKKEISQKEVSYALIQSTVEAEHALNLGAGPVILLLRDRCM